MTIHHDFDLGKLQRNLSQDWIGIISHNPNSNGSSLMSVCIIDHILEFCIDWTYWLSFEM